MVLAGKLAEQVRAKDYHCVRSLVGKVQARPREIRIELTPEALANALKLEPTDGPEQSIELIVKARLTRTGRAVRLVHTNGKTATSGTTDPGLVALLGTARRWWARIASGEIDIATLSREEGVNDSYVSRVVRMNFLSPRIVEAMLDGTHPVQLNARWLRRDDLPNEWEQQWEALTG